MIRIRQLTLTRGLRPLLESADADIGPGERVALIGENGCGKSTLLATLAGDILPDAGAIDRPPGRLVRLEQTIAHSDLPAWRYLLEADQSLIEAQQALAEADQCGDGLAIARAHERWQLAEGHSAQARAHELLAGLGFSKAQAEQSVNSLSGGWKMRLNLGRALVAPADLLLLDEPTNHLDLDAVLWLERRLLRLSATVLVVSHDRDFLDRIATASLRFEHGRLERYAGGYSACESARAVRMAQRERTRAAQQAHAAKLQAFVDRFRAQATKARQAQSRLKALERLQILEPVRATRGIGFEIPSAGNCPDPILKLEAASAGYAHPQDSGRQEVVLDEVKLTVGRGARIGLLGRNGAGKSTLVRTLVGEQPALSGRVERARAARIGYFAQQQVDLLDPQASALLHLQRQAPTEREQTLRDFLGGFAFRGDDALRPVGPMSGGEKARLALALILWEKPQLLVLDEPTNHLDALTRDALADALAQFDGALVLVSHDRYLLRATVDELWRVSDRKLAAFDGDLEDYAQWLLQKPVDALSGASDLTGSGAATDSGSASRRDQRRAAAETRQRRDARLRPLRQRLEAVDREMAILSAELGALDEALSRAPGLDTAQSIAQQMKRRAELQRRLESLESEWLEQAQAVEDAESGLEGSLSP